ncbi:unnamed protein product [Soboliphyme baturini]|uniref:Sarcosine oxidase n=1 Tax=Soboliphyme baturini TaxID=241478 RepID=A0A183IJ43_9BILA|nr:unnamed protein product [Soboliphyme baturini]
MFYCAGSHPQIISEKNDLGLKIIEQCPLRSIVINDNHQVEGVETRYGLIRCKHFINTAGYKPSMRLPVQECLYSYMITEPFEGVSNSAPIIHDMDLNVYIACYRNRLLCGGFDRHAFKVVFHNDLPDSRINFHQYSEDWDTFAPVMEKLTKRFPNLLERNVKKLVSGVDTFTPDGYPIVSNYYCATGMNGCGTALAPGLGSILARWIIDCEAPPAITLMDVARFIPLHANKFYLKERAPEVAARSQSFQWSTARKVRTSPIHQHLKSFGGVFGEIMGYERALFFAKDKGSLRSVGDSYPLGKPVWFKYLVSEYEACRERVAIMDMSSYTKLQISGREDDVVKFLQKVSSAHIDIPVGVSVYTGMQHEGGGYVTDCTLNRFGRNQYFMVAPSVQQTRSRLWLEKHLDSGSTVIIHDVTSMYMTLCVVGPSSRLLLQELTDESMSGSNFPTFGCKEINIGFASGIKAVCVTHCGELGWTLYIPNEFAQYCFERLLHHGESYGLQLAGYYALRTLRIEKFYVYWGTDIDATTSPAECGRLFRVNFKKDFIGKQALLQQKEHGVKRLYVQLLLKDHNLHTDPWPQGREPIYRDGIFCGFTTSSAYAFTLGCQVCLGYVFKASNVEIANRLFPARVSLHSPNLPMISSEHPDHYRPTQ